MDLFQCNLENNFKFKSTQINLFVMLIKVKVLIIIGNMACCKYCWALLFNAWLMMLKHCLNFITRLLTDLTGTSDTPMSRRKSLKKSLRESFRRLRRRRSERRAKAKEEAVAKEKEKDKKM